MFHVCLGLFVYAFPVELLLSSIFLECWEVDYSNGWMGEYGLLFCAVDSL
jgi:hypothetical protein